MWEWVNEVNKAKISYQKNFYSKVFLHFLRNTKDFNVILLSLMSLTTNWIEFFSSANKASTSLSFTTKHAMLRKGEKQGTEWLNTNNLHNWQLSRNLYMVRHFCNGVAFWYTACLILISYEFGHLISLFLFF